MDSDFLDNFKNSKPSNKKKVSSRGRGRVKGQVIAPQGYHTKVDIGEGPPVKIKANLRVKERTPSSKYLKDLQFHRKEAQRVGASSKPEDIERGKWMHSFASRDLGRKLSQMPTKKTGEEKEKKIRNIALHSMRSLDKFKKRGHERAKKIGLKEVLDPEQIEKGRPVLSGASRSLLKHVRSSALRSYEGGMKGNLGKTDTDITRDAQVAKRKARFVPVNRDRKPAPSIRGNPLQKHDLVGRAKGFSRRFAKTMKIHRDKGFEDRPRFGLKEAKRVTLSGKTKSFLKTWRAERAKQKEYGDQAAEYYDTNIRDQTPFKTDRKNSVKKHGDFSKVVDKSIDREQVGLDRLAAKVVEVPTKSKEHLLKHGVGPGKRREKALKTAQIGLRRAFSKDKNLKEGLSPAAKQMLNQHRQYTKSGSEDYDKQRKTMMKLGTNIPINGKSFSTKVGRLAKVSSRSADLGKKIQLSPEKRMEEGFKSRIKDFFGKFKPLSPEEREKAGLAPRAHERGDRPIVKGRKKYYKFNKAGVGSSKVPERYGIKTDEPKKEDRGSIGIHKSK